VFIHAGCFCFDNPMGILVITSHFCAGSLLWLAALVMPVGAQTPSRAGAASTAPTPAPAAQTAPQPVAQPAAPGRPHPFTLAAAQQGVLSCSSRINQVVSALGVSENSGGSWLLPPVQQDQRLAPLVVEMPISLGGSAYISATFAPNQANGCGASVDAVVYWPQSCEDVAKQSYVGLKLLGRLKKDIAVLDGGANIKIFLMPAGAAGCISIRREVVS
jgi:hypothetical protein